MVILGCTGSLLLITIILLLAIPDTSQVFDDQREGFIFGFGMGGGLTSIKRSLEHGGEAATSGRENRFSFQTDFRIGYARNEQSRLYWSSRISWFSMREYYRSNLIINGVGGLGYTYFFRPTAPSFYFSGSVGISTWLSLFGDEYSKWSGVGVTGGFGYEFVRHYSVELNVGYTRPASENPGTVITN